MLLLICGVGWEYYHVKHLTYADFEAPVAVNIETLKENQASSPEYNGTIILVRKGCPYCKKAEPQDYSGNYHC